MWLSSLCIKLRCNPLPFARYIPLKVFPLLCNIAFRQGNPSILLDHSLRLHFHTTGRSSRLMRTSSRLYSCSDTVLLLGTSKGISAPEQLDLKRVLSTRQHAALCQSRHEYVCL